MNVFVKFLGGAKSVTGSKYLLEIGNKKVLVDCGLFQGRKELRLRNWSPLPEKVDEIDAIIITHAHIDHSGYLPKIVKDGFTGPIYCSDATADLMDIMLKDAAKLQEEEAEYAKKKGYSRHEDPQPLFKVDDVEPVLQLIQKVEMNQIAKIFDELSIEFLNAGHILGACIVNLYIIGDNQHKKLTFSGDLGRQNDPFLNPPEKVKETDILFVESTYGNKEALTNNVSDDLAKIVKNTIMNRGCLLIPAFSVGRTQNLLYYFVNLMNDKKIPNMPIYVDSPMAISVTHLYKDYKKYHKLSEDFFENCIFDDKNIHYIQESIASKSLNEKKNNAIIISASGMCTGGRILHHLYHRLPRENDTILIAGYQGEETRGDRILKGEKQIKMFGEYVPVKAHIEFISNLSAHASQTELMDWITSIEDKPKMTFVIHGEVPASEGLKYELERKDFNNVIVPEYLEKFSLFEGI